MKEIRPALMAGLYAASWICIDGIPQPINRGLKLLKCTLNFVYYYAAKLYSDNLITVTVDVGTFAEPR